MSHFQRIFPNVDVAALAMQLDEHPELWDAHGERRAPSSPHADSSDIWVRYRDYAELTEPARYVEPHVSVWYPSADVLTGARDIAEQLMLHPKIRGERLGGVLITRLAPGARIKPHTDGGWHACEYQKFYVAVRNRPGSVFGWPSGSINASDGEVWWFRNDVPHWVRNGSDTVRYSMVVCIKTDAFADNFRGVESRVLEDA